MRKPCVLAVGKFESIHLGHRALVDQMMRLAQPGLASALVVFEPHPYRVLFDPEYKPLFTRKEREYLERGLGVDYLLEYPFDRDFAALSPGTFCVRLYDDLQAKIIVVGEGYRFGHKRKGKVGTLRRMARHYKAQVHVISPHGRPQEGMPNHGDLNKTSTSTIRTLLSENKLQEAESLLGYPFFVMGEVTPGRQLGRTIGFPTINLYPSNEKFLLADGVYATRTIIGANCYKGITNIGLRPTVETADVSRSVETHLLDFEGGDLYGKQVRVEFLRFIRPEQKFESLDALKAQIAKDLLDFLGNFE